MSGVSQLLQNILGFPFIFTERLPQHHSHRHTMVEVEVVGIGDLGSAADVPPLTIALIRKSVSAVDVVAVLNVRSCGHIPLCSSGCGIIVERIRRR